MIYEVNSNDPKEGILMSDKNNNVMMNNDMNNNMNNDNDPKERMRKRVKKAAFIIYIFSFHKGGKRPPSFYFAVIIWARDL